MLTDSLNASVTLDGIKTICAHNAITDVSESLRVTTEIKKFGNDWFYRQFKVENPSNKPSGQITLPYTLDATIPCPEKAILHALNGDSCGKESFMPIEKELAQGDSHEMEPTGGRSSNTTAFPIFDVTIGDKTFIFAVGWSGQWKAKMSVENGSFSINIGLSYSDFYLNPGESYCLPSVLVIEANNQFSARKKLRKLLMTEFSPFPKDYPYDHTPISAQPFDRYFWCHDDLDYRSEEGQLLITENSAKCKYIDTIWLDAGWFKKGFPYVGTYDFDTGFPNGLKPIADAVHGAGMRFMVWFEPERIYRDSDIYNEHPEFLLSCDKEGVNKDQFLLDLGNDEAWQFTYNTLTKFIADNGIDNYRQDFNMDPLPYWLLKDEENRIGITEIRHINGHSRLWDALKADHPSLLIDNCASGGRRIDLETLMRSVPMWRSDLSSGAPTETYIRDAHDHNITLTLSEYIPYHGSSAFVPEANYVRSGMTSGLACEFEFLSPKFDTEKVKLVLEEVSRLIPLWKEDFYPITYPTNDLTGFSAYQIAKDDMGFAMVFRLVECESDTFKLCLKAIKPDMKYRLTLTDEQMNKTEVLCPGNELIDGITVTIPQKRTSLLVEYSPV